MVTIPSFSTATQATDWIKNHSGLHLSDLIDIFNQFKSNMPNDPTILNSQSGLYYSGTMKIPQSGQIISSQQIANQLSHESGGAIAVIDNTQTALLLGNAEAGQPFFDALSAAAGGEDPAKEILFGSRNPGGIPASESLWGQASSKFGESLGTRPVGVVGPEFYPNRVFGSVEFPGYLFDENPRGPLMGIPQSEWQAAYHELSSTMGPEAAMNELLGRVKAGGMASMANLEMGIHADGTFSFGAKPDFIPGSGVGELHLPTDAKPIGDAWTHIGAANFNGEGLPLTRPSHEDMKGFMHMAGKIPGLIEKLGVAGAILAFGAALFDAGEAEAAGNSHGAQQIMGNWALDFLGDLAGSTVGSVAGAAVAAEIAALLPEIGIILGAPYASGLFLLLGLAGSVLGSTAGVQLAHTVLNAVFPYAMDYISPVVVDLHKNGFDMSTHEHGVWFDIDNDGFAEKTAFPINGDAILVRDLNKNGLIDNQKEMFGDNISNVNVPNGTNALSMLQAIDSNHDNMIDAKDAAFATLRLWIDTNHNGISDPGELLTMAEAGIRAFQLVTTPSNGSNYNVNGSQLVWYANWIKTDGTVGGQFGDINFAVDQTDSWYVGDKLGTLPVIKPETMDLPVSRGYGTIKSLPVAASENATLLTKLHAFDAMALNTIAQANTKVADLLYTWAGVSAVTPESGTIYYNAKMISFMEKFFGMDFKVDAGVGAGSDYPVLEGATWQLSDAFAGVWQTLKSQLMVQGPLQSIYSNSYYDAIAGQIVLNDTYDAILARAKAQMPTTGITALQYWQEVGLPLVVDARNHDADPSSVNELIDTVAGFHVPIMEGYFAGQTGDENYRTSIFNDYVTGGTGNDTLQGMEGDDSILGGDGADSLEGSEGSDTLYGGNGNDVVIGDHILATGDDVVYGGDGSDTLIGGNGNDALYGDAGADVIDGGKGSDTIEGDTTSADSIDGGIGDNDSDWIVYRTSTTGIRVNLQTFSNVSGIGMGGDTLTNFENVLGTAYADSIVGNGLGNDLEGGAGADTLDGGTVGNDWLDGGSDFDWIVFNNLGEHYGVEAHLGGRYDSNILAHGQIRNVEGLSGSDYGDTLYGDNLANKLLGNGGDDIVDGGGGNDTIFGGTGRNYLFGKGGIDLLDYSSITTGMQADLTFGTASSASFNDSIDGFEQIRGGTANDVINGSIGAETLWGGNGADTISGGGSNDWLYGDAGNDRLVGGTGNDRLSGGTGADKFVMIGTGQGNDTVTDFTLTQGDRVVLAVGTLYQVTDLGADIRIAANSNTITLLGVADFSTNMVEYG